MASEVPTASAGPLALVITEVIGPLERSLPGGLEALEVAASVTDIGRPPPWSSTASARPSRSPSVLPVAIDDGLASRAGGHRQRRASCDERYPLASGPVGTDRRLLPAASRADVAANCEIQCRRR